MGIRVRTIAPRVIQAAVPGSSVFLLLDERVTIIDAGPVRSSGRILAALRAAGRTPDNVERIVLTHYHLDHMGGLAELQRRLPARTAVHAVEAPYVRGELPMPPLYPVRALDRAVRRVAPLLCPPARVDDTLHDGDELPVLGGLHVVATPGHTRGHIALHLPELGMLIAGDALQVRDAGRLIPPHRLLSEDMSAAHRSLGRMAAIPFTTLALSHFAPQRGDAHERLERLARMAGPGTPSDNERETV